MIYTFIKSFCLFHQSLPMPSITLKVTLQYTYFSLAVKKGMVDWWNKQKDLKAEREERAGGDDQAAGDGEDGAFGEEEEDMAVANEEETTDPKVACMSLILKELYSRVAHEFWPFSKPGHDLKDHRKAGVQAAFNVPCQLD